jgi:hypothetical protein
VCDLTDDNGNRNAHAADASPTAHDLGIKCDSIKSWYEIAPL